MITKPIILLTNRYSENVLKVVRNELPAGLGFIALDNASKEELVKKAKLADYFLASGRVEIDKEVIEAAPKLKMIQRTGVGTDTLDLKTLSERKIPVYVNSGINSISVAEHTILLIFSVLRNIVTVDSRLKTGIWQKNDIGIECYSLQNKVVGLIGVGNIGKAVVKMLQPFGVTILYYDPFRLRLDEEQALNIQYCDLADLLKKSDILSLHCPLSTDTRGIIGKKEISMMKAGSFIINTARGPLVDEEALIIALQSGHIKGAGLDVFSEEPINKNNPLLGLNNVVLTPHVGGLTLETFSKMMRDAFENIQLFENGQSELLENKRLK
jgi:phosphoglycerate dehydrogenase-like enzyme